MQEFGGNILDFEESIMEREELQVTPMVDLEKRQEQMTNWGKQLEKRLNQEMEGIWANLRASKHDEGSSMPVATSVDNAPTVGPTVEEPLRVPSHAHDTIHPFRTGTA